MKVFNVNQIRLCDATTISEEPITSLDLMERAARKLLEWINDRYEKTDTFCIFAGRGNNGGDALALARLLYQEDFLNIKVFFFNISSSISKDCKINYERLNHFPEIEIKHLNNTIPFPEIEKKSIIIDGIFGSGLSRPIEGYLAQIVQHINQSEAQIIAIDMPSGLFADKQNTTHSAIIRANHTLSFQFPKKAFFFAENELFTGKWHLLDIELSSFFIENEPSNYFYIEKKEVKKILKKRPLFSHKGTFGHAFLIAGNYKKAGASVLASRACIRSGVGLLTVHIPKINYSILQTSLPEAMISIQNEDELSDLQKYSAVGIGPGIGKTKEAYNNLTLLMKKFKKLIVIDADAINLIAENEELQRAIPPHSILTPHPKEFDRLTKKHSTAYERLETQKEWSEKQNVYIVLKGAFTSVSTPCGKIYFNSTGNSGMATAGSGDVLTGIILAFLTQGYLPQEAAIIGVFLHGLAGDMAKKEKGKNALIASDIIEYLGKAFLYVDKKA